VSDRDTTITDVMTAVGTMLLTASGLTSERVTYGATDRPPVTGDCVAWRMVTTSSTPNGPAALTRFETVTTFELRMWAQGTADTPLARDIAAVGLWQRVRAATLTDRTLGATVRDVVLGELTSPSAAADVGVPVGCATAILTARWQWQAVP
jgi:hypothetical protein